MNPTFFLLAEAAPTPAQFGAFWVVLAFLAGIAANIVTIFVALRRQSRRIEPQPLEVKYVTEFVRKEELASRASAIEKQVEAMRIERMADNDNAVKSRKALYHEINSVEGALGSKIESVRKELSEKIETMNETVGEKSENVRQELSAQIGGMPAQIITILKNTGALGRGHRE